MTPTGPYAPLSATPAHAAALAAIHAAAFAPPERWSEPAIAAQLVLPGAFGLLDPLGRGMALARVAADEAEILTLAVAPAARRQGLGRALLLAAEAGAARLGARRMFLEVSEANPAATALYLGVGYCRIGVRRDYYADGSDALVLSRTLAPADAAVTPGAARRG